MKAVMEIIFAIILLVGGVRISNVAIKAFKKETLEKVYKGLPSLENFTRTLTRK